MRLPSGRREQAPALPRFVCFGDRGEVSGNRFKRGVEVRGSPKRAESSFGGSEVVAPYRDLFVSVIEVNVRFLS